MKKRISGSRRDCGLSGSGFRVEGVRADLAFPPTAPQAASRKPQAASRKPQGII
ncbi:MAG: hypothetical protein LBG87_01030 [Spirochaetaceae bacterium]|nr:hypothetical protein [Spirochaetaceae bacterium]